MTKLDELKVKLYPKALCDRKKARKATDLLNWLFNASIDRTKKKKRSNHAKS